MTDYDPLTDGVKVALIGGDAGLGAKIDANTAALIALKASIDAAFPH